MKRTLVKSPRELWPEFSEVERLADHLGEFGEISISRVEPGHVVVWEAEHASGMVELESSGGGTEVTLTAEVREADAALPSTLTVHRLIPDLAAWERSAAEIEASALRQSAAAQRAAERTALRAERERRRRGRRLFHGRDAGPEALAATASPLPEPPPFEASEVGPASTGVEPAVPEDRARAVLETTLEKLSPSS